MFDYEAYRECDLDLIESPEVLRTRYVRLVTLTLEYSARCVARVSRLSELRKWRRAALVQRTKQLGVCYQTEEQPSLVKANRETLIAAILREEYDNTLEYLYEEISMFGADIDELVKEEKKHER